MNPYGHKTRLRFYLGIAWINAREGNATSTFFWCQYAVEVLNAMRPMNLRDPSPKHVVEGSWWGLYYETKEEIVGIIQSLPRCPSIARDITR